MGLPASSSRIGSAEVESVAAASYELLKRAPFPVISHDAALVITGWNEGAARCFGFEEEEALGRSVTDLVLSGEPGEAWRRSLADGVAPRVFACARKGGGTVTCEWRRQAVIDERGRTTSWLCMAVPAPSEPAPSPSASRTSLAERILNVVMNTLPIAIWAVDRKGTYIFHDGRGVDLAGVPRRSWLGLNLWEIWANHEGSAETLRQVRAAMDAKESSHAFTSAMERHWESWCVPDENEDGEVDAVITLTLDVTETRETENELRAKLQLIQRQQQLIQQLSTPIIQVWDGVLTVPLVGMVDSTRAEELMDSLLGAVSRSSARYAIIDLTGVETVDTQTASYLIGLVRAIRLLGAEAVITGIRATVAQTIVSLGVELSGIPVHTNLRSGLQHCIRQMAQEARLAKGGGAQGAPGAEGPRSGLVRTT
ncbi:anti-anti-sigma factor [Sorangium cellulosum]|uniref:Anti-anti-sigma factor n=1 Tax=Sorangium cellulosum TaxID=56 RepID=A0A2L0EQN8_SORCE|nr:PAS domain-containing protein [Sorangium cellulosum]AUX41628.1 anti-anti-sigma factor [Sorangium cellulosum]